MEVESRPQVSTQCLPWPVAALAALCGVPARRPRRRPLAALSRGYSLLVAGAAALLDYVAAARSSRGYHADCYSYYVPHMFTRAVITAGACASVLALVLAPGDWLDTFVAELGRVDHLLGLYRSAANRATLLYAAASFTLLLLPYLGGVVWDVVFGVDYNALIVGVIVVIVVAFEQFFVLGLVLRYRLRFLNDTVKRSFSAELETFSALDKTTVGARRRLPPSRPNTNEGTLKQTTLSPSCEHLLTIKIAHMKLTKLAGSLNDMFTVPVTSTAVQAFVATVQIIFDILLILLDQEPGNDTAIFIDVCFLVMNMMIMFCLAYCCESITSEARRTAELAEHLILANETGYFLVLEDTCIGACFISHAVTLLASSIFLVENNDASWFSFSCASGSEAVSRQLVGLSAQARHSPVAFCACSLFPVDASLLTAFTSYVATYTIILLQFVVSNSGCSSSGHVTDAVNVTTSPVP